MSNSKRKTSSLGLEQLILAGREQEAETQKIKSVATETVQEQIPEIEDTQKAVETMTEVEAIAVPEKAVDEPTKKGIDLLFAKRDAEDMEAVKIPRHLHRELKVLAGISRCTMAQMLGNIIENYLSENKKAISSYKKKMI